MVKKIISIFLVAVFLIPLLPIQEVGQLIAGATMTEEIPDTGPSKSMTGKAEAKWLVDGNNLGNNFLNDNSQYFYIHFSETLPFCLAHDVQTPPPDFFC